MTEPQPPALTHAALFLRFLRFGAGAFGGPVAQIATIRRELVEEERWMPGDRFNRLVAVMQALPGPEAHELCVHLGIRAKGRVGGILAGLGFMLPGLILMLALAWGYSRLPVAGALGGLFLGVQAAVLAVIVRAVHRIGEHILVDRLSWAAAAGAALAMVAGAGFAVVLPAAGAACALAAARRPGLALGTVALAVLVAVAWGRAVPLDPGPVAAAAAAPGVAALFLTGLKGGLLTFGGAYTAIPFVRGDTVGRGWMTDGAFLDGVGLAGVIPAPLVIFATFAGWASGGLGGALAITAGMFLLTFAFSLLFYERLEAVVEHRRMQLFLAGVAAAVVGVIAVTIVELARATAARLPDLAPGLAIFAAALLLVYRRRSKAAVPAVLAAGAAAGAALLG